MSQVPKTATNKNTSFPVSAQECAASARMDADPVTIAATVFATATSRFAAKATMTVLTLADESADARASGPSSWSDAPVQSASR